jgi:hypothetical protein
MALCQCNKCGYREQVSLRCDDTFGKRWTTTIIYIRGKKIDISESTYSPFENKNE